MTYLKDVFESFMSNMSLFSNSYNKGEGEERRGSRGGRGGGGGGGGGEGRGGGGRGEGLGSCKMNVWYTVLSHSQALLQQKSGNEDSVLVT